ncbi:unnamed protein product [Gadus morhua 'NCC']
MAALMRAPSSFLAFCELNTFYTRFERDRDTPPPMNCLHGVLSSPPRTGPPTLENPWAFKSRVAPSGRLYGVVSPSDWMTGSAELS